jgi:hypothetical protein
MKNLDKEINRLEQENAWEESDEVVQVKAKKPLDKVIPIRLSSSDWDKLHEQANELGMGPTTLARMWILERLRSRLFSNQDLLILYNMAMFMKVMEKKPKTAKDYLNLTESFQDISYNDYQKMSIGEFLQRIQNTLLRARGLEGFREFTEIKNSKVNVDR